MTTIKSSDGALTGGSLCTGGGGLDLGLTRSLGVEWRWFTEPDPHCSIVLGHHYPGVPNHGDLFACDWSTVEKVDIVTAGFPCFVAGTLILTRDGYRPIEELVPGDEVLTHRGRWRSIRYCHETPDAPLRRIAAPGADLVCTDDHPFLAREAIYTPNGIRHGFAAEDWVEALALTPSHFLAQVLPEQREDEQTLAFWRLVGRYLADGWTVDRKGRTNGRVVICCARDEEATVEGEIADAGYRSSRVREESVTKYHITRGDFYRFVQPFGRYAHGKTLPGFALELDPVRSLALLDGYLAGDGWFDETRRCWSASTASSRLAYSIALLAQRAIGTVASVHRNERSATTTIAGRVVNQRPEYQVRIPLGNRSSLVEDDGFGWKKLKRNERLVGRATVYNIAVEEDESYVAQGAVVHNCPDYSLAGKRAGIEGDHGQVWFGVASALRALRPRYVVLENVPGIRTAAGVRVDAGESALGVVLADLAALGYRWAYDCLRAADVGAPHGRDRWFCVARLAAADAVGAGVDAD